LKLREFLGLLEVVESLVQGRVRVQRWVSLSDLAEPDFLLNSRCLCLGDEDLIFVGWHADLVRLSADELICYWHLELGFIDLHEVALRSL
jgi:hypothetical protein